MNMLLKGTVTHLQAKMYNELSSIKSLNSCCMHVTVIQRAKNIEQNVNQLEYPAHMQCVHFQSYYILTVT